MEKHSNDVKLFPLFALQEEERRKRYVRDSFFVLGSIALLTGIIFFSHLSTRISDSLLLYLLVIVMLAYTRGLYASFLASLVAFFVFDFLFVPPVYSLAASKFEDVLGLVVFL